MWCTLVLTSYLAQGTGATAADLCSYDLVSLLQTRSVIHHAEVHAGELIPLVGGGGSSTWITDCLGDTIYYPFKGAGDTSILRRVTSAIATWTKEKWFWFQAVPVVLAILVVGCAGWFAKKPVTTRRTESWTGFRAFLAIMIYLEHLGFHSVRGGGPFLLLSGAVMGLEKRDVTTFSGYLGFVVRRLVRIYPAYWLCLVLTKQYTVSSLSPEELIKAVIHVPQDDPETFLGLQSWPGSNLEFASHFWFVSTIIALYLMFPLVNAGLVWLGTKKDAKRCAFVLCFCYLCDITLFTYDQLSPREHVDTTAPCSQQLHGEMVHSIFGVPIDIYRDPFARLPEFVTGILIAHMLQALSSTTQPGQANDSCSEWSGIWLARTTDAAAIGIVVLMLVQKRFDSELLVSALGLGLFSPLFALLLFGLAFSTVPSYARKLLTLPFILELGKWSYGIYIWHPYVLISFSCPFTTDYQGDETCYTSTLFAVFAYAIIAAATSFKFIEEPVCKLVVRLLQPSK